jgi:hypothetical protein
MGLRNLRDNGLIAREPERKLVYDESLKYKGREEPLYSV